MDTTSPAEGWYPKQQVGRTQRNTEEHATTDEQAGRAAADDIQQDRKDMTSLRADASADPDVTLHTEKVTAACETS